MSRNRLASASLAVTSCLVLPATALAHGISEANQQAIVDGGYLRYLLLGATHMVTGYDHLLFVFGVIFFLSSFRDVLKYVTAFTLGHSLTLVLATAFGISANYHLLDAIIALSVCYKGFDNLDGFRRYLGRPSPNLLLVIFGFGLIHGFGLSTRLQELPLGEEGLILRILSFNVGVELGQVLALAVMLLVIGAWRRTPSFGRFAVLSNRALVGAGLALFLFQVHAFGHSVGLGTFEAGGGGRQGVVRAGMVPGAWTLAGSSSLRAALDAYDRAFQDRDVLALWDKFADDVVLHEQGEQNVGREEALGKHLGPDLRAFEEMSATFSDVRVREFGDAAIVTRRFAVRGKLPERYFFAQGLETQGWALQQGEWKLAHVHWSFPSR